jgi:hypothetical protein
MTAARRPWLGVLPAVAAGVCAALVAREPAAPPVTFTKRTLTAGYFCDGLAVGDFNRDGKPDVVAGPYWYEGPDFTRRHEIYPPVPFAPEKGQSDSMLSFVYDFNGDGWPDVLVLGRVHLHAAYWYENPRGREGPWTKHFVFERVRGESPAFVDIDGDGKPELVCHWQGRWGWLAPDWAEPTKPWAFHPVSERGEYDQFYHGTGVGDLNGDSRPDLVVNEGWWEQPPPAEAGKPWPWHPFRFGARGGAQMLIYDVNGDGLNDVITSIDAHGWGLAWFEQVREGGRITFRKHVIMGDRSEEPRYGVAFSQPHALALADIDGDGLMDVVTGKRRWAHGPTGDVEPGADPVVYWFRLVRESGQVRFEPHRIDASSGVGVQIAVADVNGDGAPDVLTASKLGTFLFLSHKAGLAPCE